jgi:hypothetical protein
MTALRLIRANWRDFTACLAIVPCALLAIWLAMEMLKLIIEGNSL